MAADHTALDAWIDTNPPSHGWTLPSSLNADATALADSTEIVSDVRCLRLNVARASTYGQVIQELWARRGWAVMYGQRR